MIKPKIPRCIRGGRGYPGGHSFYIDVKQALETLADFGEQLLVCRKFFNSIMPIDDLLLLCTRLQKRGSKQSSTLGGVGAVENAKEG